MPVELHTPRLLLRRLRADDLPEYVRVHAASAELYRPFSPWSEETIEARFEHDLSRSDAEWADGSGARFVAQLPDGRHAAYVNLSQVFRRMFLSCVIGWRGNAELLNRGFASEAVSAALSYAFAPEPEGLGLHRVQAAIIPANAASLRLAEKCGFRREGLALKYLKIAGDWQDHVLLAKLAEEHAAADVAIRARP